jgi:hypothetical protein
MRRMLVAMIAYRQPVLRSRSVSFFVCRAVGRVRRTISRSPRVQLSTRLLRPVSSAACAWSVAVPSWPRLSVQAVSGRSAIAASSASVMCHPTVNFTVRHSRFSCSMCSSRSWVAPAPIDPDEDLPPVFHRQLSDRLAEDPDVVGDRV